MSGEWEELERRQSASIEGSGKLVALGVMAMLGFLAWTQFSGERNDAARLASAPAVVEATTMPPTVDESSPSIELQASRYQAPPVSRTGRESYVGVFECERDGQRVVSDRPCGPDAQPRTLVIDQPDPRELAAQRQRQWQAQQQGAPSYSAPAASGSRSMAGSAQSSNEADCEKVDQAIDRLNARMRQPYGAAEGERLRARWHDLKRQRYELRCGR